MAHLSLLLAFFCVAHLPIVHVTIAQDAQVPFGANLSFMCKDFETEVTTLEKFNKFYEEYTRVNDCLHMRTMLKDANKDCMSASEECERNYLLYPNVKELGELLKRFRSQAPICTVEYSMRIHHLHNRLLQIDTSSTNSPELRLLRLLRILANRTASRCRSNLAARLENAESRAPDIAQHITLIYGLLTGGKATDGRQTDWLVEPEHYVPILEREQALNAPESIGRGSSGYDFKLTKEVKVTLEATKISCRALRVYHTNLIGSLGLLASLGYAAPRGQYHSLHNAIEEARVRRWTVSAILCQSFLSLSRMGGSTVDGKVITRVRFLQAQEPEITIDTESEALSFRIPEALTDVASKVMDLDTQIAEVDSNLYDSRVQINKRKFRLIYGPNYSLAKALYTYFDYTQKERQFVPFEILGIPAPTTKNPVEEEEEEEEEE